MSIAKLGEVAAAEGWSVVRDQLLRYLNVGKNFKKSIAG
jgi:hypothetical protein